MQAAWKRATAAAVSLLTSIAQVGHNAVELIMRELGIKGIPTRRLPKGARVAR